MNISFILLALILIPASSLLTFSSRKFRGPAIEKISLASLTLVFLLVCYLYPYVREGTIYFQFPNLMGTGLYLKLNMLRYTLVFITSFIWIITYLYSTHYIISYKNKRRYFFFLMVTFPTTLGFFMSDNILNLFTFFELMTVASYFLVIHDEDNYTHKAGFIYIIMSIGGGLVQLMGIFLLYNYTSTLMLSEIPIAMEALGTIKYVISIPIIIGFGVKACMFPLHVWLPKVYSPAPSPATSIFSAILTKTGIFGIFLVLQFTNFDINLSFFIATTGLINMFLGGLLALHQRNIKKTFAYSSMSQIGYILLSISIIGILGEHGSSAYYASIFHMVTHALTKTIIFLGCGVIIYTVGDMSLNNIRGFGQKKALYKITFLIGLLGTAAIPGFSGFISKNMIHHAVAEATSMFSPGIALLVEIIFFISSSFTVAYSIKIYKTIFIEKYNASSYKIEKSFLRYSVYPMLLVSVFVVLLGIKPQLFFDFIGYKDASMHFYTSYTLTSTVYICITGLIIYYFYIRKKLKVYIDINDYYFVNPTHGWFDLERDFYLPLLNFLFIYVTAIFSFIDNFIVDIVTGINSFFRYLGSVQFRNDVSNLYYSAKNRKLADKSSDLNKHAKDISKNYLGEKSVNLRTLLKHSQSESHPSNRWLAIERIYSKLPSTKYSLIFYALLHGTLFITLYIILLR
ncbi:MAG: complex I subunit 5 family protein [Peptostreptococcales bacterium]